MNLFTSAFNLVGTILAKVGGGATQTVPNNLPVGTAPATTTTTTTAATSPNLIYWIIGGSAFLILLLLGFTSKKK